MGFETQEEAEHWAESMEFLADQRKEEKLLASAALSMDTLDTIERSLIEGLVPAKDALYAAYVLGKFDGKLEMAKIGQRLVEKAMK